MRPYSCTHCEKVFACKGTLVMQSQLTKHMKIQTGEKQHECSYCDKHIKVHTGEKPYQCSHCEMNFVHIGHLTYMKIHLTYMKIHTG